MGDCHIPSFFKPRVGKNYENSLLGKKLLILGASFYCLKSNCEFFSKCTNEELKDSREFNSNCPEYTMGENKGKDYTLENSPTIEIDDYLESASSRTYATFSMFMEGFLAKKGVILKEPHEFWDSVCFTNYVQFILPHFQTYARDIDKERFNSNLEKSIKVYTPDIVICWGNVINSPLWNFRGCDDKNALPKSEYYRFHWATDGKRISFVNCDHPSSTDFILNYKKFEHYLELAFTE